MRILNTAFIHFTKSDRLLYLSDRLYIYLSDRLYMFQCIWRRKSELKEIRNYIFFMNVFEKTTILMNTYVFSLLKFKRLTKNWFLVTWVSGDWTHFYDHFFVKDNFHFNHYLWFGITNFIVNYQLFAMLFMLLSGPRNLIDSKISDRSKISKSIFNLLIDRQVCLYI